MILIFSVITFSCKYAIKEKKVSINNINVTLLININ